MNPPSQPKLPRIALLHLVLLFAAAFSGVFSGMSAAADSSTNLLDQLLAPGTTKEQRLDLFAAQTPQTNAALVRQLNDRADKAARNGKFDSALQANAVAFEIAESLAEKSPLGACYDTRGLIRRRQSQHPAAVEDHQKALEIFRNTHHRRAEAKTLAHLANVFTLTGKFDQARAQFESSLRIATDLADKRLESLALHGLGEVAREQDDFTNALARFQASWKIEISLTNQEGIAEVQGNIGDVYVALGDYDSAQRFWDASLAGYRALEDKQGEGMILGNMGVLKEMTGRYTEALELYQASLKIKREIRDQQGIVMTLNNIGALYLSAGQYPTALGWFQQSRQLAQASDAQANVAKALHNLGATHQSMGNFAAALPLLQASLELEHKLGNRGGAAETRGAFATVLEQTGDDAQAAVEFEAVLNEFRELGMKYQAAETLHNLGDVYGRLREWEKARENFAVCLKLRRELQDRPGEALTLAGLGDLEFAAGHLEAAGARYQAALHLATEVGGSVSAAQALSGLGDVSLARGQADALDWYTKALETATAAGDLENQARAKTGIGRALRAQKRLSEAIAAQQQAIALIERARGTLHIPSEAIGFFARHTEAYEELTACLLEAGQTESAWKTAERAKARTLLDMLGRGGARIVKAMSAEEQARNRALEERLAFANLEHKDALSQTKASPEHLRAVRERLDAARRDYDAFQREMYIKHPTLAVQRGQTPPPSLDTLKPLFNDLNLATLEFQLGDKHSTLFVITANGGTNSTPTLTALDLDVGRTSLAGLAWDLHERLVSRSLRWPAREAVQLSEYLLAPAAPLIPDRAVLCIIPDGALWEVPFAALGDAKGVSVIDRHAVFYAPSLSTLLAMRQLADRRAQETLPSNRR